MNYILLETMSRQGIQIVLAFILLILATIIYVAQPIKELEVGTRTLTKTFYSTLTMPKTLTYTFTTYSTKVKKKIVTYTTRTRTTVEEFNRNVRLSGGQIFVLKPRLNSGDKITVKWSAPYTIYVYIQRPNQLSTFMCAQTSYLVKRISSSGELTYTADSSGEYYVTLCHPWLWSSFDVNVKLYINKVVVRTITSTITSTSKIPLLITSTKETTYSKVQKSSQLITVRGTFKKPSLLNTLLSILSAGLGSLMIVLALVEGRHALKETKYPPTLFEEALIPYNLNYKILERIGSGGFSYVFKAKDPEGNIVALKIPKVDYSKTLSDKLIKNFEKEAKIWKMLNHENIVKLLDYGSRPIPYIVMEFMDKGSLRDILASKGKLRLDEAINFILNVAEALRYVHRRGIVHRDIKPENILLNSEGKVKLTDFGIAKVFAEASTTTSTKVFKGTLAYAAPEQIDPKNYGEIDWRTDIYQLSAVFYELLTGEPPFKGDVTEVLSKILREKPRPIRAIRDDVPEELENIILKGLEKRKEDRWQSIDEFINALKKFKS